MDVDASHQGHLDPLSLFDLSSAGFPWRSPIPREIEARRALMSDVLIFDILLASGGIRNTDTIYPPTDVQSLRLLLKAIETSTYDALKKECLIYFLLKWHHDGRDQIFKVRKCLPAQFVALADAYWYLDTGLDVPRAVSILSDARLNRDYTSKILQAISLANNPNPIIRKYIRSARPLLTEPDDIDAYAKALMDSSLLEAWQYQRTFPEGSDTRSRLIRNILRWSLSPKPRSRPLTQLLAYSFSQYEQSLIHAYALDPPQDIPSTSIPVIQELVIVRLIQAGQYASAVKLDRQFSLVVPSRAQSNPSISDQIKRGAKTRKELIDQILDVLPKVERELLELDLEKMVPSSSSTSFGDLSGSIGSGMDLSMSWESIRGPAGLSASSSFVAVSKPNGLDGSATSSALGKHSQKQQQQQPQELPLPLRRPRVSDGAFAPIPQRSGAPRFGGPVPPVAASPSGGGGISGVLRAARGIPQFDVPPPAQMNQAQSQSQGQGERRSLFETVGSANRARNAFYDPTSSLNTSAPAQPQTISASLSAGLGAMKRPYGALQRDGGLSAGGRIPRTSLGGNGIGGAGGMEDVSSASARAVRELLAEGGDGDIEIEGDEDRAVSEPEMDLDKSRDGGLIGKDREDVEMGEGSEGRRSPAPSGAPIRPSALSSKAKGKGKARQSVPGADEDQGQGQDTAGEFSFSLFASQSAPEPLPPPPVVTALGRKSPGRAREGRKLFRTETEMNMPPGAFIHDEPEAKHDPPNPPSPPPAAKVSPTKARRSAVPKTAAIVVRSRKSTAKKEEASLKRSFPGSLISDDDDFSQSDGETEEQESHHPPPVPTVKTSNRTRRGARTSDLLTDGEGEDLVMPLPPTTPARRQPARKSRTSTPRKDEKRAATKKSTRREAVPVKVNMESTRITRRSSRLSNAPSDRGGSESPEPLSPVKGRRAGVRASGGGTGITASTSGGVSKGRSSGKKGR